MLYENTKLKFDKNKISQLSNFKTKNTLILRKFTKSNACIPRNDPKRINLHKRSKFTHTQLFSKDEKSSCYEQDSAEIKENLNENQISNINNNGYFINDDIYINSKTFIPHRWNITIMTCIAFILCNMDKVNMSVAVIPMAKDLGWSLTSRGIIQSAFFWGYSITQLPAGWICTKISGDKILLFGVVLWSFGTLIAPSFANLGFPFLCFSRILVGLGEGFAPSAATNILSKQVPASERSRAVSTVFGGLDLGSAIGLLLCGPLIRMYKWPCPFYLFGIIGFIWCMFWPLFKPSKIDSVMKYSDQNFNTSNLNIPWKSIFKSKAVWAIIVAHFCFNWGYYTLLSWLPSFFELALKLNVQNSSFLTVVPYVAMTAMTPLVGPMADYLIKKGTSITRVRKLCQGLSFLGPAICMIACAFFTFKTSQTSSLSNAIEITIVCLLSVSFALSAWARSGLYCNHQDLSPRFASTLLGITNTAGAIPGILGAWSTGILLDRTGAWDVSLFYPIVISQIIGLVFYSLYASSEKQSWS